jgi:hypothetical protein
LRGVYLVDHLGRLTGAVTLPQLVQAKAGTPVDKLADHDPVRVGPDADAEDVALVMSNHNLVSLPVVDPHGRMIGLITVDDVLETTIPIDWRRRSTGRSARIPEKVLPQRIPAMPFDMHRPPARSVKASDRHGGKPLNDELAACTPAVHLGLGRLCRGSVMTAVPLLTGCPAGLFEQSAESAVGGRDGA